MPLANTATSYGLAARTLHWATALLIFVAFPLGYIANTTPPTDEAAIARIFALFSLHKTTGIIALLIGLLRIVWSLTQPRPAPMPHAGWERSLAAITHWTLTVALVAVPLTGWLAHSASPGLAPIRLPVPQYLPLVPATAESAALLGGIHWVATKLLAAAILLHVAGALKHAIIDRDGTLARMTSGTPGPEVPRPGETPAILAALALWTAALALGALTAERPPAPPVVWTTSFAEVSLVTMRDAEVIGQFQAADVTLSLSEDDTGTLDVFVALDSIDTPRANTFVAQVGLPILTFSAAISPAPPDLSVTGTLDAGGIATEHSFTIRLDGDTVRLLPVFPLTAVPDYALKIEAVFERPDQ